MRISDERLAELLKHATSPLHSPAMRVNCLEMAHLIADLREAREVNKSLSEFINPEYQEQLGLLREQLTKALMLISEATPMINHDPMYVFAHQRKAWMEKCRAYFTAKDAAPKGVRS